MSQFGVCHKGGLLQDNIDGLVQDCSNSIANTLELLQSSAKPFDFTNPKSVLLASHKTH